MIYTVSNPELWLEEAFPLHRAAAASAEIGGVCVHVGTCTLGIGICILLRHDVCRRSDIYLYGSIGIGKEVDGVFLIT